MADIIKSINGVKIESGDHSELVELEDRMSYVDGVVSVPMEMGNITYKDGSWVYANNNKRARVPEGAEIYLDRGDTLGVTQQGYSLFWGRRNLDGTVTAFSSWYTSEVVVKEAGYYTVIIRKAPEEEATLDELAPYVYMRRRTPFNRKLESVTAKNLFTNDMWRKIGMGRYVNANGGLSFSVDDRDIGKTITSELIPVEQGHVYHLLYSVTPTEAFANKGAWYRVFYYDSEKAPISYIENSSNADSAGVLQEFDAEIEVIDGASYIRASFRSYDDGLFKLYDKGDNYLEATDAIRYGLIAQIQDLISEKGSEDAYKYVAYGSPRFLGDAVRGINHRGWHECPENTLTAYIESYKHGFRIVETDISFTSDSVPVCLHDETINRTARNSDGSTIAETVKIGDITYAEALSYDFGIYKGAKFAGEKIPTFYQFIELCRGMGLHPYIELKNAGTTVEGIRYCVELVRSFGMFDRVTWISFNIDWLNAVKELEPSARLGFVVTAVSDYRITQAEDLKSRINDVFIDSNDVSETAVSKCMEARIPLEAWTIDEADNIRALPPYISGVTSNKLVAEDVLRSAYMD